MDQVFRLGICVPQGRNFGIVSRKMQSAAEMAVRYSNERGDVRFRVDARPIPEPCNTRQRLTDPLADFDVIVGPMCSYHALDLLRAWPPTLYGAISPSADLPSLSLRRGNLPFFRVCGDGVHFAHAVATTVARELACQHPLIIYDATHRWWAEIAVLVSQALTRELGRAPVMRQYAPRRVLADIVLPGRTSGYDYSDIMCFLGNQLPETEPLVEFLIASRRRRLLCPPALEPLLSKVLYGKGLQADQRAYTLRFQPPAASAESKAHLRRLHDHLGADASGYASLAHDAALVAVMSFDKLFSQTGLLSDYAAVVHNVRLSGSSGVIQFDRLGNRTGNGLWQLAEWRRGRFTALRTDHSEDARTPVPAIISASKPFTNIIALRRLIRSCEERIDWCDQHFSRRALEDLAFVLSAEPSSIRLIRILSGPANVTGPARRDWRRFKEEMMGYGIDTEWRVKSDRGIHDRFIMDKNSAYNVPPVNAIYEGQYSEILPTPNRPPFEEWWANGVPIEEMP